MDSTTLETIRLITSIPAYAQWLMFLAVGVAGIAGVVMAATTRPDAFEAAGRQSKMAWVAILAVSTIALLLRLPFIAWFAAVAVGIYFFDVRPQINNILRGNYGW
ncbi:DUF2516 family protein [Corynebacterium glaucum]|uniref:DUF2516 family protein n=1 Tax=Corynebacterium glaucum TaxID=187491 RepID=UPI00265AE3C5|nr:DUF2516 family protein [Corynebacterium glaucum]